MFPNDTDLVNTALIGMFGFWSPMSGASERCPSRGREAGGGTGARGTNAGVDELDCG